MASSLSATEAWAKVTNINPLNYEERHPLVIMASTSDVEYEAETAALLPKLTGANAADVDGDSLSITSVGAPVEEINPLGHEVTFLSATLLNVSQLIGVGIFSTPGVVLKSVGSIGLHLTFWLIGPIIAAMGLTVYSELGAMFPNRSGAEVVYLEQAYPRPKHLVPVTFAVISILLSYSATNSIVFAQYMLDAFDIPVTPFRQTALAIGVATFAVAVVGASTRFSLRVVNAITFVKVATLFVVALTGLLVLSGAIHVERPKANFENIWEGTSWNGNALATAIVKVNFTFVGWGNAFNLINEVRSTDRARTVRRSAALSLLIVTILFFLCNIAYIAAVPKEEIKESGQLVAALFFKHVFGEQSQIARKVLAGMIACSCVGNIIAVTVGQARVLREVARQGVIPFPEFFASTKPFGTPLASVSIKYVLTVFVIVVSPAADAFNFLLDLASYPGLVFAAATGVGVFILRKRRARAGLPPASFVAPSFVVAAYVIKAVFLLIMPWVPPEKGHSDVSFWYATYCVVGIAVLVFCGLYYYVWIILLPRWGGYTLVEETVEVAGGGLTRRLVRKYEGKQHPQLPDNE